MTPSVKKILNNGSRYEQIKDRNIAHCSSTFPSSTVSPIELSEIAVGFGTIIELFYQYYGLPLKKISFWGDEEADKPRRMAE